MIAINWSIEQPVCLSQAGFLAQHFVAELLYNLGMIAALRGKLLYLGADHVVLETGGVGWLIYVPRPLLHGLQPESELLLYTHLVVREDALQLYGFGSLDQRGLFETLIAVSGVGPRVALALLSSGSSDEVRRAIGSGDTARLARVPGIGKKTAERLVLELRGKLEVSGLPVASTDSAAPINREVIDALVNLGFSAAEATAAVNSIPGDSDQDFDTRLRLALRYFGGA